MAIGCFVAFAVIVGLTTLLGVIVHRWAERDREEAERKRAEHRAELFEKVKAGDDGSGISVMWDPQLIEMFASDPECVANLTTLNLSMVDLSGSQAVAAGKLANVREIMFYDCDGVENLLTAMKGSASIEELSFDTTLLSDDGVRLLATFPNLKKVYFAWVNDQAREKLLRDTLPGVEIEIEERDY